LDHVTLVTTVSEDYRSSEG